MGSRINSAATRRLSPPDPHEGIPGTINVGMQPHDKASPFDWRGLSALHGERVGNVGGRFEGHHGRPPPMPDAFCCVHPSALENRQQQAGGDWHLRATSKQLLQWSDDIEPVQQPTRFGNQAFKTWCRKVEDEAGALLINVWEASGVDISDDEKQQLTEMFCSSFGNPVRLDFGTGHECAFAIFLFCLFEKKILKPEEHDPFAVLGIFKGYVEVAHALQQRYMLEAAGSRGVWGLDDFHFLTFLWGAGQLAEQQIIEPAQITERDLVRHLAADLLYFDSIEYVMQEEDLLGQCAVFMNEWMLVRWCGHCAQSLKAHTFAVSLMHTEPCCTESAVTERTLQVKNKPDSAFSSSPLSSSRLSSVALTARNEGEMHNETGNISVFPFPVVFANCQPGSWVRKHIRLTNKGKNEQKLAVTSSNPSVLFVHREALTLPPGASVFLPIIMSVPSAGNGTGNGGSSQTGGKLPFTHSYQTEGELHGLRQEHCLTRECLAIRGMGWSIDLPVLVTQAEEHTTDNQASLDTRKRASSVFFSDSKLKTAPSLLNSSSPLPPRRSTRRSTEPQRRPLTVSLSRSDTFKCSLEGSCDEVPITHSADSWWPAPQGLPSPQAKGPSPSSALSWGLLDPSDLLDAKSEGTSQSSISPALLASQQPLDGSRGASRLLPSSPPSTGSPSEASLHYSGSDSCCNSSSTVFEGRLRAVPKTEGDNARYGDQGFSDAGGLQFAVTNKGRFCTANTQREPPVATEARLPRRDKVSFQKPHWKNLEDSINKAQIPTAECSGEAGRKGAPASALSRSLQNHAQLAAKKQFETVPGKQKEVVSAEAEVLTHQDALVCNRKKVEALERLHGQQHAMHQVGSMRRSRNLTADSLAQRSPLCSARELPTPPQQLQAAQLQQAPQQQQLSPQLCSKEEQKRAEAHQQQLKLEYQRDSDHLNTKPQLQLPAKPTNSSIQSLYPFHTLGRITAEDAILSDGSNRHSECTHIGQFISTKRLREQQWSRAAHRQQDELRKLKAALAAAHAQHKKQQTLLQRRLHAFEAEAAVAAAEAAAAREREKHLQLQIEEQQQRFAAAERSAATKYAGLFRQFQAAMSREKNLQMHLKAAQASLTFLSSLRQQQRACTPDRPLDRLQGGHSIDGAARKLRKYSSQSCSSSHSSSHYSNTGRGAEPQETDHLSDGEQKKASTGVPPDAVCFLKVPAEIQHLIDHLDTARGSEAARKADAVGSVPPAGIAGRNAEAHAELTAAAAAKQAAAAAAKASDALVEKLRASERQLQLQCEALKSERDSWKQQLQKHLRQRHKLLQKMQQQHVRLHEEQSKCPEEEQQSQQHRQLQQDLMLVGAPGDNAPAFPAAAVADKDSAAADGQHDLPSLDTTTSDGSVESVLRGRAEQLVFYVSSVLLAVGRRLAASSQRELRVCRENRVLLQRLKGETARRIKQEAKNEVLSTHLKALDAKSSAMESFAAAEAEAAAEHHRAEVSLLSRQHAEALGTLKSYEEERALLLSRHLAVCSKVQQLRGALRRAVQRGRKAAAAAAAGAEDAVLQRLSDWRERCCGEASPWDQKGAAGHLAAQGLAQRLAAAELAVLQLRQALARAYQGCAGPYGERQSSIDPPSYRSITPTAKEWREEKRGLHEELRGRSSDASSCGVPDSFTESARHPNILRNGQSSVQTTREGPCFEATCPSWDMDSSPEPEGSCQDVLNQELNKASGDLERALAEAARLMDCVKAMNRQKSLLEAAAAKGEAAELESEALRTKVALLQIVRCQRLAAGPAQTGARTLEQRAAALERSAGRDTAWKPPGAAEGAG
ncbi:phosphotyrosyl phosphatase [Cyclospora cayetanensis]|uniref:peptidylprolyl isomerase n=1 Tax=Cyclospora cayetanensis TaxID=88456 RepID=A0A1D3DAC2_9EIME|nr:phosphotyrosyl phosphatase [Cyclospora cayetanensis]